MLLRSILIVEKLKQRANDSLFAEKTYIGKNVRIHSKATIEAGSKIPDGTVIDYGEMVRKE